MELITAILSNPASALTTLSVALAFFFAWLLFSSFKSKINSFEKTVEASANQVTLAQTNFEEKIEENRKQLKQHSEDMGKMTKATSGDFLKIQEKLFDLRQELISEVEKIKSLSGDTTRALTLAHELTKLSVEGLQEKMGRIIIIEKDINVFKVQTEKMQAGIGQNKSEVIKSTSQIATLAKLMQDTREKLRGLEHEIKKDKNEI